MYGATDTTAGGSALAMTGLATGNLLLTGVGIIFAGLALVALFRRQSAHRP